MSSLLIVIIILRTEVCNLKTFVILSQLVRHCESSVVGGRTPKVGDEDHVGEVDEIEPAIEDEPASLPVEWHEVWARCRGKGKGVEEEESKDDHDGDQDCPPQMAVHGEFDVLLAFEKIFDGRIKRVESPHVESSQGAC